MRGSPQWQKGAEGGSKRGSEQGGALTGSEELGGTLLAGQQAGHPLRSGPGPPWSRLSALPLYPQERPGCVLALSRLAFLGPTGLLQGWWSVTPQRWQRKHHMYVPLCSDVRTQPTALSSFTNICGLENGYRPQIKGCGGLGMVLPPSMAGAGMGEALVSSFVSPPT